MQRAWTTHDLFIANLQRIMEATHITQAELARRMQCSRPYVSQIISQRTDPGLSVVDRVARALDVNPCLLFEVSSEIQKILDAVVDSC